MRLLHTMIRVRDIKKSLEFYTKLFDLELANEKRLEDCTLYFLSDKEGYTQIELTYNDETLFYSIKTPLKSCPHLSSWFPKKSEKSKHQEGW